MLKAGDKVLVPAEVTSAARDGSWVRVKCHEPLKKTGSSDWERSARHTKQIRVEPSTVVPTVPEGEHGPIQTEVFGCRAVLTGGAYSQTKQAVYTTEDMIRHYPAAPPPAATPIIETALELKLTILHGGDKDPHTLLRELLSAKAPLEVNLGISGLQ